MPRERSEDTPVYCSYCGRELEVNYDVDGYRTYVLLKCPKKRTPHWWNFYHDDKHMEMIWDTMRTVLNFDPITGEEIDEPTKRIYQ